jgi:divalent metal cation (Fe/Co/Zn/Cd) transporter
MLFVGVIIFFSSVFIFFKGLAREAEVDSDFPESSSSDWIGLVLIFFKGLAREADVDSEPALVSFLQQMLFVGVIIFFSSVFIFFKGLAREVEVDSDFPESSSSDWIGLVLIFFKGLAREVEVDSEPALVSFLQQMLFVGVII